MKRFLSIFISLCCMLLFGLLALGVLVPAKAKADTEIKTSYNYSATCSDGSCSVKSAPAPAGIGVIQMAPVYAVQAYTAPTETVTTIRTRTRGRLFGGGGLQLLVPGNRAGFMLFGAGRACTGAGCD